MPIRSNIKAQGMPRRTFRRLQRAYGLDCRERRALIGLPLSGAGKYALANRGQASAGFD